MAIILKYIKKYKALFIALIYFIWPLDLVPDFLAMFGWGDDLAILLIALISQYKKYEKEKLNSEKD
jgi:uncharacterized membrane protein YkvA (DUF1232 family)